MAQSKQPSMGQAAAQMMHNRGAVEQLAQSGDAQQLLAMLKRSGGVEEAAQAAAQGNPAQLMEMMNRLMHTQEGAQLVQRITKQAKEAGLS